METARLRMDWDTGMGMWAHAQSSRDWSWSILGDEWMIHALTCVYPLQQVWVPPKMGIERWRSFSYSLEQSLQQSSQLLNQRSIA